MIVVGLDPGGRNAFGWAVFRGSYARPVLIEAGLTSAAAEALHAVACALDEAGAGAPDAVGLDAPMYWSAAGDRSADALVRRAVCDAGGSGGTVGHVNSLKGACLVQGALAAKMAGDRWPGARLTETHPKALMRVLPETARFGRDAKLQCDGFHLRDAALGAMACFAMLEGRKPWRDLSLLDPDRIKPLGVEAAYWFPVASGR